MSVLPNNAIWNFANQYLQGMQLTYVSDTAFTVAQGAARDSTGLNDIVLARPPLNDGTAVTTAFTLSTALNGAGGLDQGTIAASTFYYVFAIASSQNSTINLPPSPQQSLAVPPFTTPDSSAAVQQDGYYVQANVMISTSLTSPLLPYGFDMFRRIGCVATDASSHIRAFTQTGSGSNRTMRYQIPVAPGSAATAGSTTYATIGTLTTLVPQVAVDVIISAALTPNSAGNVLYLAPYGNVAIASNGFQAALSAEVTAHAQQDTLVCPGAFHTGVLEIDYATTSGSDTVAFLVQGYVDAL